MPNQTICQAVADGRVLVSDGAWGTFLQQKGLEAGACPELWCVERRNDVLEIATSYIDAGADMIQANSFGGTRFKLAMFGLADRVSEINRAAAAISREAAGADRWVIASVGPTGKMLILGEVSEAEVEDAFAEQIEALVAGGTDAVCIETMSATDEAAAAIRAARRFPKLEVIATFTFEKEASGNYRTMMGVSPTQAAEAALGAGAHIIGSNCGNGFDGMIDIAQEMRAASGPDVPILVHANAGLPKQVDGQDVFPETPDDMASKVDRLVAAGASVVGGCCGTTPAHIAAIRRQLYV